MSFWQTVADAIEAFHVGYSLFDSSPKTQKKNFEDDWDDYSRSYREEGYVYFLHNPETDTIKIGYSKNPKRRIRSLQTANSAELETLKIVEGDEGYERSLHRQFSHLRIRGEWFRADYELWDYIDSI